MDQIYFYELTVRFWSEEFDGGAIALDSVTFLQLLPDSFCRLTGCSGLLGGPRAVRKFGVVLGLHTKFRQWYLSK